MGMSDIRVRRSRLLRATPRQHPDAGTSFGSQMIGRHESERPCRSLTTLREPPHDAYDDTIRHVDRCCGCSG